MDCICILYIYWKYNKVTCILCEKLTITISNLLLKVRSDEMSKSRCVEVLCWSIAFPGFGQFLNGKFLKGLTLLLSEFIINTQANLNTVIISSFHGEIDQAIHQTNYQWLMFYPCVYLFGMWDAYRDAGGGNKPYSFLPFVISAYFGTIGVIYSSTLQIMGIKLGPIWLSILFLLIGVTTGLIVRNSILKWRKEG